MLAFAQAPKAKDERIPVRYTDIRQAAGITFLQDATATDEKYYLETMGTGVAWLDYDQDGLDGPVLRPVGRYRYLQAAAAAALRALSQQRRRNVHRRHRKSRRRRGRDITARALPSGISTTTAIPIST